MDHPYGKQYGQEGNPRAYMTMRDYRNLPYQWGNQQPIERNPNPPRSMREYRDQWMSAPVYHVPSTETSKAWDEPRPREDEGLGYPSNQGETIHIISEKTLMREKLIILTRRLDEMEMKNQHNIYSVNELSASQPSYYNHQSHGHYGENCQENVQILNQGRPPLNVPFGNSYIQDWKNHSNLPGKPYIPPTDQQQFTPTSQQQQPPPLHPLVEQAILDLTRKVNDYVEENKKIRAHSIVTVEDNLNKKIDGLKDDFEHKRDNLQDSSEDLIDQQQCPPEEECQRDTRVEEQRVVTVQANQETETVESSLNNESDGFQSKIDQNLDILQESISKLTQQPDQEDEEKLEEESQEDECLTELILGEQVQLQPQEELKVELVKAPPEELQDTPQSGDTFWPRKQEEQTSALISEEESQEEECLNGTIVEESCLQKPQQGLVENSESLEIGVVVCLWEKEDAIPLFFTEKSSGHEGTQENIIQPSPIGLDTIATAQDTKTPLPVAPSDNQVYILPTPAANSNPAAPVPKGKSNPLPAAPPESVFILSMPAAQPKPQASTTKATPSMLVLKNFRRLVASVHTFATTSNKMANAYIAWHSGWYWCGFGFGTPGPRHF